MIFKTILWYALLKGAWKGLHKPPLITFDAMLIEFYIEPIRQMRDWSTTMTEAYELSRQDT